MKIDMKKLVSDTIASPIKKAAPVLSFPIIQDMGITVNDLVNSDVYQAEAISRVAKRVPSALALSFMDLSVEAECFGAEILFRPDEIPTVIKPVISSSDEIASLQIPKIGTARSGLCVNAVAQAAKTVKDRPVMAGVIGPYSLAGRLSDVTEIMFLCFEEPERAADLLDRATEFIISYCLAFKEAGANGIVMAEPLAGMLSPALAKEFSAPYVKRIIDAVQDDNFAVCYHNCGNNTVLMADSISTLGAAMYHFGDAINMTAILPLMPSDALVMGNISASGQFLHGTPESIYEQTCALIKECSAYPNFVPSSGCDIPPAASWSNIDAFFAAVTDSYK